MRARVVGYHSWSLELHRKLLSDPHRNRAFNQALSRVSKGATVADIGAGTGFLSFLALKNHASRCHLYEADLEVSKLSRKISQDAGLPLSRLHFYPTLSQNDRQPPKCDVVVSETLGCFALEENLIENMNDARRFLKDEKSILIPCKLRQYVCPVLAREYDSMLNTWDDVGVEFGLNLHAAKAIAYHLPYQIPVKAEHLMPNGVQVWDEIDFYAENPPLRARRILTWTGIKKPVYGFCVWWEADLVPGVKLSTSPMEPPTHWEQCYLPLIRPLLPSSSHAVKLQLSTEHFTGRGTNVRWHAQIRNL